MRHSTLYLPNGFTIHLSPTYGGLSFRYGDGNENPGLLAPGWSVVIYTEKQTDNGENGGTSPVDTSHKASGANGSPLRAGSRSQSPVAGPDAYERRPRFVRPTLNNDCLFISSISLSASYGSKSSMAPARLLAVMLWATLWWYFHQEEPESHEQSSNYPSRYNSKEPRADWRVYIKREGVFSGRHVVDKLERAGLVLSEDSSVGIESPEGSPSADHSDIFVSRRCFWQLDPRIFLFALGPGEEPYAPVRHSNPVSPKLAGTNPSHPPSPPSLCTSSYIPTFSAPPAAPLLVSTAGVQHPIRPKPPQQADLLYTRYIPSLGQTISFRIPSLPRKDSEISEGIFGRRKRSSSSSLSSLQSLTLSANSLGSGSEADVSVLHRWMNKPHVNEDWGLAGPQSTQEYFLQERLSDRHLFPVLGCWDGLPFGYFEIYWLKEDKLGRVLTKTPNNWDRGLRCLFGEDGDMDTHRFQVMISSLLHYCWLSDSRTQAVISNPKANNAEAIHQLQMAGFSKKREAIRSDKHSAIMKIKRENWEAPVL